jgi:hypothetical protein
VDIYHLCLILRLRQYLAKDNLHFLLDLQQLDICHFLSATPSPSVSGQPFKETGPASLGLIIFICYTISMSDIHFNAKPATSGQEYYLVSISIVSGHPLNSFLKPTSG